VIDEIAGIELTGGTSRWMGVDKTMIRIDGEPCIARIERVLRAVAFPCLELGPGKTWFPPRVEASPANGPLMTIAAGCRALLALITRRSQTTVVADDALSRSSVRRWTQVPQPVPARVVA
jgi:molybdopterin-guanine dinucleotide biosynthesis protein A